MIDINTLHIGSHVLIDGQRREVFGLGCGRVSYLPHPFSSIAESVLVDSVEPIALTPKLLTELGFKYHEYDNGKLWELDFPDGYKDWMYLELDESTEHRYNMHLSSRKEIDVCAKCEWLHELENWVYMVYDEELIKE